MLSHMLRAAAAGPRIVYNANYTVVNTAITDTSVTYNNVDFGSAATGRIVAVYISSGTSALLDVSSVTIGGVSASLAVSTGVGFRHNVIAYATVTTGTSGTVVVNYTNQLGNTTERFLSCASIYNAASSTPVTGQSFNNSVGVSPSASVTLTPSARSVLFAGYSAGGIAAGTTSSWTNATETSDNVFGVVIYTNATATNLEGGSITITATGTDTAVNRPGLVVAAWR